MKHYKYFVKTDEGEIEGTVCANSKENAIDLVKEYCNILDSKPEDFEIFEIYM